MPVQWRSFTPRLVGPQFLRIPPARYCWFLSAPHQHAILDLHFLPNGKGSYPCLGAECAYCHIPKETHTYTIVLWTPSVSHPNWTPAIIDLGMPDKEECQLDQRGKCVYLARKGGNDKQTGIEIVKTYNLVPELAPRVTDHRDARPYLMRRWNIVETAEYYAPREAGTQARLDFTPSDKGEIQ